ncbi:MULTISPECIES: heavy-metal-associated domain-containing protein [Saccharopolyspora]|jgi:copper ion binding protein|uniref:Copper chaperone n=3 Tax=Saccharopolyspora TaxID=1835 RepID=A0A4R4VK03_9PSEU|nr:MULTISPECIES: heavy-metal-associated domain-containing protein [Saccharopolyspora]MBQ0924223.1 heavy-metal-associated domain-containing protein [Saccharopolyspora endophytica]TDD02455.1 copper chaperone [Saccharopolyspora terrae]TDD83369.1 copper chaperone [Saccharopolyspora karakumensis]
MSETTYHVTGMTCQHCVASVTEEVGAIDGVTDVKVDLPSGAVTVVGSAQEAAVRAAVEEAGYELAS